MFFSVQDLRKRNAGTIIAKRTFPKQNLQAVCIIHVENTVKIIL